MINRVVRTIICGNNLNTGRGAIASLMVRAIHKLNNKPVRPDDHEQSVVLQSLVD